MPATSSAPGSQPQSAPRPKVRRRKPSTTTPDVALSRSAPDRTNRQSSRAQRRVTTQRNTEALANAEQAAQKAVKVAKRAQRQGRREKTALKQLKQLAKGRETAAQQALERAERKGAKAVAKGQADPVPKSAFDLVGEEARKASAQGIAHRAIPGLVSKGTAGDVRTVLTGSRNPSAGELALAVAPLPAAKGAQVVRGVLRGRKVLGTAKRAEQARDVVETARKARKAERVASRAKQTSRVSKARTTGAGMGKQARKRLSRTEAKAAAKRTAHRTADRAVRSSTSPVVAAASAAPGDVGDRTRAFVEGTVTANPAKAGKTTLEAVPGLFTGGASVVGAGLRSIKEGDPKYLSAAAKAMGEGTLDALKPYVSGDADKVREATEEGAGYILAPLAPRGAVSRPAKAAGRGAKRGAKAATSPVTRRVRVRRAASGKTAPGKTQRAGQIVGGGKKRKDVAVVMARHRGPGQRLAQQEAGKVVAAERKSTGTRHLRKNRTGPDAGAAAAVLARHGIGRKGTLARLKDALRDVDNPRNEMVNLTNTAEWLRNHPDVLKDDAFWKAVDEFHRTQDPITTSPTAKFSAQGDAAGVPRPEARVPHAAREFTNARTREGAFKDLEKSKRLLSRAKGDARVAALQAAEATGPRRTELAGVAATLREAARKQEIKVRGLGKALKNYRAKDARDQALVDEYVADVRAKRHPDLEDPAWMSEKPIKQDPDVPGGGHKPGLVVHRQTGAARKGDMIDRSFPAVLRNSIIDPHIRTATSRGIREVLSRFGKTVDGKRVFTGPQLVKLAAEGKIDLTKTKAVPSRWWKAATEDEVFDAVKLHEDTSKLLRQEVADLKNAKGTKYVLLDNEHAFELADQLQPEAGRWEKVIGTTAGIGSRIVLYSPAWVAAQVVNETSQLIADAGVRGTAGAAGDLVNLWRTDRPAYEAALRVSGDPSPAAHPVAPRTNAAASEYLDISEAGRAMRRTPVGRFLYEAFRLRTFSNIDRWKSTRIRAVAKLAKENKGFGTFTKGLGGMVKTMPEVSAKLAKMSRAERHAYIAKNPRIEREILDHVDDMMGNWEAFTRFERSFGPLAAFYPYLRMSLRWTFHTFPKGHPVKAQIFYLLAQQNRDQLEKLLGAEPSFIQGAYPALYDKEGKPDAVLPGGARFGAPGSNVLVEAMGEGNVIGALRLLNPGLSTPLFALTGLNPFTGKQDVEPGTPEWGMHALSYLLSAAPPLRATGLSKLEDQSDASKVFENIDPNRAMRSFLNPFIPLSGERARMQQTLSDALDAASNKPEYGDLIDAIMAKDSALVRELANRVDLAKDAKGVLEEFMPPSKAEDKAVTKAGQIYYGGSKALKDEKKKPKVRRADNSIFSQGGDSIFAPSGGGKSIFDNGGGGSIFK